MTQYRTCIGCRWQGQPCTIRDALRQSIKGLGVTSIKWRCRDRVPRFEIGDPVWVETVAIQDEVNEYGDPYRDDFPGAVIRNHGASVIVYIEPGAHGRDFGEDLPFEPRRNGFCRIPLSRVSPRDGVRETICPQCELPASKGHQPGYICAHNQEAA